MGNSMQKFDDLCMKCMNIKGNFKQCPFCGYIDDNYNSNKASTRLILQSKYILGNKISENVESICYMGYDKKNNSKVHIKEFFPLEICTRSTEGLDVIIKESYNEKYERLKNDFLNYFRTLAKVRDISAIVPVYDIFLENGTAYVISEVVDGINLSTFIKNNTRPLDWDTAKILFMPIISAFNKLSQTEILHLSISPESLIIGRNGKMYISNFSTLNSRQIGVFSEFEFNKGFTAPEQYIKNYQLTQAADVYGLTASLFFALVGFPPKDATEREVDDRLLIPIKVLKNIPPHVVSAISNGLKINVQTRTQTFEILRDELTETSAKYLKEQDVTVQENYSKSRKKSKKNNFLWIIGAMVVFLVLFILIFIFYIRGSGSQKNELQQNNLLAQEATESQQNILYQT